MHRSNSNIRSFFKYSSKDTTGISTFHKLVATSTKTNVAAPSTNGKFYRNYKNFNSNKFGKELGDAFRTACTSSYREFQKSIVDLWQNISCGLFF